LRDDGPLEGAAFGDPMGYQTLKVAIGEDRVGIVTMSRPEARNAMNTAMMEELRDLFAQLYVEPNSAACLVLTGEGQGFCSGADLKERKGMPDDVWRRQHAIVEQMMRALMDCPIPIIAAVNGAAYAGGMELALGCDFVYAAQSARFALTEVTLGIMPGAAGTQNLPRAVGVRRAKEIVLTGQPFTAEQALSWGMVNKVCPDEQLMGEVLATARRIAANAPVSVRQAKKALDKATELDRASGYAFEIEAYNRTVVTEDRQEGINAFNEKRKPQYKGR
jgi:enoyl-CoA hydratase/carnithine racemase